MTAHCCVTDCWCCRPWRNRARKCSGSGRFVGNTCSCRCLYGCHCTYWVSTVYCSDCGQYVTTDEYGRVTDHYPAYTLTYTPPVSVTYTFQPTEPPPPDKLNKKKSPRW